MEGNPEFANEYMLLYHQHRWLEHKLKAYEILRKTNKLPNGGHEMGMLTKPHNIPRIPATVIAVGNYEIELDGTCATLMEKRISQKTGEPYYRLVGYYPDAAQALTRLLEERVADARTMLDLEQTRALILEVREDILQAVRHQKLGAGTTGNIAEDAPEPPRSTIDGEAIPQYGSDKLEAFLGLTDGFGVLDGEGGAKC